MGLFDTPPDLSDISDVSDISTRALSATVVETDFVAKVYENIAWAYDLFFGPTLHPGRVQAIQRMAIAAGDRVLEVGVGTGINACLYPRDCRVTGIDLSVPMLDKARDRLWRASRTWCARELAPITKELRAVVAELESLPMPGKVTRLDVIRDAHSNRVSTADVPLRSADRAVHE